MARDEEPVEWPLEGVEGPPDVGQATERAARARHGEHDGDPRPEAERGTRGGGVLRLGELRADRHAGHDDPLRGDAAGDELVLHLVGRDAVAVDVARDPLAVRDEVGDDGRVGRRAPALRDQRRHRGGGRGVDGHDRVRPERVEQRREPAGAQARDAQGKRRVARHPVAERVTDAPEHRGAEEDRVVERARGALEERGDQLTEVVHDRDPTPLALEGPRETLRRGVVAGAVAGSEDEDAFHRRGPHATLWPKSAKHTKSVVNYPHFHRCPQQKNCTI